MVELMYCHRALDTNNAKIAKKRSNGLSPCHHHPDGSLPKRIWEKTHMVEKKNHFWCLCFDFENKTILKIKKMMTFYWYLLKFLPQRRKEKKLTRSKRNQLLLFQTRNLQNQKWIHLYQISLIWNQVLAFIKSPYIEYLKSYLEKKFWCYGFSYPRLKDTLLLIFVIN